MRVLSQERWFSHGMRCATAGTPLFVQRVADSSVLQTATEFAERNCTMKLANERLT